MRLLNAVVYSSLGILIFAIAFVLIDKLTPYHLWKEIVEDKNRRAGGADRRDVDRHVHHHCRRGALVACRSDMFNVSQPGVEKSLDAANTSVRATCNARFSVPTPLSQ